MNDEPVSTHPSRGILVLLIGISCLLSSCASIPVSEQAYAAKASMQVAVAQSDFYRGSRTASLEPGITDGGNVATTCSSCK